MTTPFNDLTENRGCSLAHHVQPWVVDIPPSFLFQDLSAWPFLDSLAKMAPPPSLAVGGLCQNWRFRHLHWNDGSVQLFFWFLQRDIYSAPYKWVYFCWMTKRGLYLLKHKISTEHSFSEVNRCSIISPLDDGFSWRPSSFGLFVILSGLQVEIKGNMFLWYWYPIFRICG